MKPVEDAWDEFDDMDDYDDVERLPCTLKYLVVCISLPLLNGFINGFAGSAQALYFRDMNWPLWHLGISLAVGFCLRLFSQYIQVQLGIWTALPMSMLHLIGAVLAIGFTTEEWAICVEIVCLCGFDSSSAIEGIAFDAFSESDDFARQATSTALAIFTVSIALACTLGGIIYDSSGWVGMSIFHGSGQGLLLLILLIYPTCRQSFGDFFYLSPMEEDVEDPQERLNPVVPVPVEVADVDDEKKEGIQEHSEKGLRGGSIHSFAEDAEPEPESSTINMPETKEPEAAESEQTHQPQARESGGVRWQLEDVDEDTKVAAIHEEEAPAIPKEETPGEKEGLNYEEVQEGDLEPNEDEEVLTPTSDMNQFRIHKGRKRILSIILPERSERRQSMAADLQNRQSQGSGKSRKSGVSGRDSRVSRRSARVSRTSRATRLTVGSSHTAGTQRTHKTLGSGQTGLSARTGRTGMTAGTMRSQLTSLAETGANFEHHFMVNSSLGPRIVTRVGEFDQKMDEVPEEPEPIEDVPLPVPQGKLSADLRIPMLLISFCVVCNSYCYSNEFGSFAILLREYYGVSSATMCALGQTGGDFLAAIVMQVAALSSEVPCLDAVARCWARIAFPPYNLCWVLLIWIGLNMMMISSMLPLAICGQVMMSSSYCLASKWAAELCHFYSMDDDLLFMNMQIRIGQAQSLAAALSSFLATLLFEQVHPTTSYIVSGSLAGVVLLIYTAGFCGRVGCQHAHLAEEEREA